MGSANQPGCVLPTQKLENRNNCRVGLISISRATQPVKVSGSFESRAERLIVFVLILHCFSEVCYFQPKVSCCSSLKGP